MRAGKWQVCGSEDGDTESAFAVEGRRLWMSGRLSNWLAAKVIKSVAEMRFPAKTPARPELVIVSSPGGSADAFWAVADAVLDGPRGLRVFALGEVCSASAWLLAAARERYVSPNTTAIVHLPSISPGAAMSSRDAGHIGTYMEEYGRRVCARLPLNLAGLPARYTTFGAVSAYDVLRAQGEVILVGEEIVAAGLADEIRVP